MEFTIIEIEKKVDETIKRCVDAVRAWDGRDFRIETDWLDPEQFVINATYTRECFVDNEEFSNYAIPLLEKLGDMAADEFNRNAPSGAKWARYSVENYWDDEGCECEYDGPWTCIQVCVFLNRN